MLTDRLLSLRGDSRAAVRDFLRAEAENSTIDFDPAVPASEAEHGHRNAALAHFMASCGDAKGNSVAGVAALDCFTTLTGWSIF